MGAVRAPDGGLRRHRGVHPRGRGLGGRQPRPQRPGRVPTGGPWAGRVWTDTTAISPGPPPSSAGSCRPPGSRRAQFPPTPTHAGWLTRITDAAGEPGRYWVPRRVADYSPRPGDIVCATRNPRGSADLGSVPERGTHCDLVVGRDGTTLEVIGGDVRNAVSKSRLPLDGQGRLQGRHAPGLVPDPGESAVRWIRPWAKALALPLAVAGGRRPRCRRVPRTHGGRIGDGLRPRPDPGQPRPGGGRLRMVRRSLRLQARPPRSGRGILVRPAWGSGRGAGPQGRRPGCAVARTRGHPRAPPSPRPWRSSTPALRRPPRSRVPPPSRLPAAALQAPQLRQDVLHQLLAAGIHAAAEPCLGCARRRSAAG